MNFQKETTILNVSRISPEGWWIENCKEHVCAGTALGSDFTENVFTPPKKGVTAKYDRDSDQWTEVEDKTGTQFWHESGELFELSTPDAEVPDGAIQDAPPEYNPETHFVTRKSGNWLIHENHFQKPYYNALGEELIVSEQRFILPSGHTFTKPPRPKNGHAVRLVKGKWKQIEDHRGETLFHTETHQTKIIEDIGEVENGWTLQTYIPYSKWDSQSQAWKLDLELLKAGKYAEINAWRDEQEVQPNKVVEFDGVQWDADPTSRVRIESTLASQFTPPYWTDANNNDQPIDRNKLQAVHTAIVQAGFEIHAHQRTLKKRLETLTTIEAVQALKIGWAN